MGTPLQGDVTPNQERIVLWLGPSATWMSSTRVSSLSMSGLPGTQSNVRCKSGHGKKPVQLNSGAFQFCALLQGREVG